MLLISILKVAPVVHNHCLTALLGAIAAVMKLTKSSIKSFDEGFLQNIKL